MVQRYSFVNGCGFGDDIYEDLDPLGDYVEFREYEVLYNRLQDFKENVVTALGMTDGDDIRHFLNSVLKDIP